MRLAAAVAAGLLGAMPVIAQETQNDPAERQVQMLRGFLQLTDDQVSKVREIVKKQTDDLRGLLTDEQKRRYDEMGRRFSGGNRGGGGPPGSGGSRGGWYPSTDELKAQLSLTDDQASKLNEIRDAVRQDLRNFWRDRQGGGNPADEFQAFQQKLRDDTTKKMRDALNDDQKAKFDEVVKNYQSQQQDQSGQSGRGGRGGPSLDERTSRVMDNLKIEDAAEANAIKAVVRRVLELMEKLESAQRDARGKVDEASRNRELSEEAVGDKIEELRKGVRDIEKELATARKDLADIVTNRQELELIRRGVLR